VQFYEIIIFQTAAFSGLLFQIILNLRQDYYAVDELSIELKIIPSPLRHRILMSIKSAILRDHNLPNCCIFWIIISNNFELCLGQDYYAVDGFIFRHSTSSCSE